MKHAPPLKQTLLSCLVGGLLGMALLDFFSAMQKLYLGLPLFKPHSYIAPSLFGFISGIVLALKHLGLRRSNAELSEREERYRNLYKNTPVMLHSINRRGELISVSKTWLDRLGYREEDVIGRPLLDFLSEHSRLQAEKRTLPRFFRYGKVSDIPYTLVRSNGERVDVLLSAVAEYNDQGEFLQSLAVAVDITERKKTEANARRLAYFDTLTGLCNRVLFQDRLTQALEHVRANNLSLALLYLDLDRFKGINDALGHSFGDLVLQTVAMRLGMNLNEKDVLARLGGDEFVLFVPEAGDDKELDELARKLLGQLAPAIHLQGREMFVSASIGIARFPEQCESYDELLRKAEIAMYAAKETGRNTFQHYDGDMNTEVEEKHGIENSLRRALERHELSLVYQPQINLANGEISGFEALLRWKHPQEGQIPPGRFISVAEETGLIIPIGDWALRTACSQVRAWCDSGITIPRIAVNISGPQLQQPTFTENLDAIIEETGFDASLLEIELTESILMENIPETVATLTDLQVRGIQVAVDDFGTGYSSLMYLKDFPINRLKIAQEFIYNLPRNRDHAVIVEAIIALSHSLGKTVIAEGVENSDQLDYLRKLHCQEIQGFYYSKPLSAWDVPGFIEDHAGKFHRTTQ
ncbi:MAG: bifunctional diguanylate cyclase/phosphodiesterase [Desulfuromonas sp.]|nr:MAG: bifunctional diguanylate cyclase/phosphodiesterase [Desulfuromonas sp.]